MCGGAGGGKHVLSLGGGVEMDGREVGRLRTCLSMMVAVSSSEGGPSAELLRRAASLILWEGGEASHASDGASCAPPSSSSTLLRPSAATSSKTAVGLEEDARAAYLAAIARLCASGDASCKEEGAKVLSHCIKHTVAEYTAESRLWASESAPDVSKGSGDLLRRGWMLWDWMNEAVSALQGFDGAGGGGGGGGAAAAGAGGGGGGGDGNGLSLIVSDVVGIVAALKPPPARVVVPTQASCDAHPLDDEEEVDEETLRLLEGIGGAQEGDKKAQGAEEEEEEEEEEEVDEETLRLLEGIGDDGDDGEGLTSDDEETLRMLEDMDPTQQL